MLISKFKKAEALHLESFVNLVSEFIIFDFETTGLKKDADFPIELAAQKIEIKNGEFIEGEAKTWYMKPPFSLPDIITELTGITDEFLADKPTEDEIFDEILEFFGESPVICGQNVKFDIGFMEMLYKRQGKSFTFKDSIDTLLIAKEHLKKGVNVENHKLETLVKYFYPDEDLQYHDASFDIVGTLKVLEAFKDNLLVEESKEAPQETKDNVLLKPVLDSYWAFDKSQGKNKFDPEILIMFKFIGYSQCIYYNLKTERFGGKDKAFFKSLDLDFLVSQALEKSGDLSFADFKERFRQ